ncbi:MAG: gamma subclass chorismate mutase AroQ [Pseudomonadales bacterium]|nr:gamma subclass chorismate mutase AroQ [Pseudomonadales bacterium]
MITRNLLAILLGLTLSWLATTCHAKTTSGLILTINQRLGLMQEVAAYKWINNKPIEDLAREAIVLDAAVNTALNYGIHPGSSKQFFKLQISAAKEVQNYWFSVWQSANPPALAPDLINDIRPKLLVLGDELVTHLPGAGDIREIDFVGNIDVEGLSLQSKIDIHQALKQIRTYSSRLEQVLATGILRIGTTGDYPPFSLRHSVKGERTFSGIDIQLGKDLAQSLGVEAIFVQTSWPTLMKDLEKGKYDIAMSGISRSLSRQARGYFSKAYLSSGKTPIVRCEDMPKFNSLSKIDNPTTRLIVNPGGTNQRFVDAKIHSAEIIVFEDNRKIFLEIINHNADVMITDRLEVEHQSALHPELCAAMKSNLSYLEKAFLMPQDSPLKNYVDTWLDLRISEGLINKLFNKMTSHASSQEIQ